MDKIPLSAYDQNNILKWPLTYSFLNKGHSNSFLGEGFFHPRPQECNYFYNKRVNIATVAHHCGHKGESLALKSRSTGMDEGFRNLDQKTTINSPTKGYTVFCHIRNFGH